MNAIRTHKEVAKILGIPEHMCRYHERTALRKLWFILHDTAVECGRKMKPPVSICGRPGTGRSKIFEDVKPEKPKKYLPRKLARSLLRGSKNNS